MDAPYVGDSVIRHELIHLFAAELGASPLKIAKNRLGLPNMALTEGLAEAYSPRDQRLSLHEWTAALERIGKRPNVSNLLRPEGLLQQFSPYGVYHLWIINPLYRTAPRTRNREVLVSNRRMVGTGEPRCFAGGLAYIP